MTDPESVPIAGSRVGRYVIIREVAQGTLGPLYIAEREVGDGVMHGLARVVPLPPGLPAKDEQTLADAIWDSTNLTHDLVLRVADVVTGKGWLTLIHEHSEGSLVEFLQRCAEELRSPFPAKVAARIALDVVEGLEQSRDHCVTAGIPWRPGSVAPGSLLLGPDGRIRALDGQITSAALRVPALRAQPGVRAFAAPEMLDDAREPSERSDVFSIGVLLWELLTGKTLFGDKASALDLGHSFKVPKITQSLPDGVKVPQGLVHAVHTALEAEPLKRQASLRELAVAIVMGVEEVATYEQVVDFSDSILEPRPDEDSQPEAPPPEPLLRRHTPPMPMAAVDLPGAGELHQQMLPTPAAAPDISGLGAPSEEALIQPAPAPEVPLLRKSPLSEPPPAQPALAVQDTSETSAEEAPSSYTPEPSAEAAPAPRDKLDTLPGQGSVRAVAADTTQADSHPGIAAQPRPEVVTTTPTPSPVLVQPAPADIPSTPAANLQPPAQPFRLVSEEPFIPLPMQPVQPVGDAPSQAQANAGGQDYPVIPSRPAPAQAGDDSALAEQLPGLQKKRTLQLSVGTLVLGFSTTVLAVIVIMLVMMRSQSPSSKEAPAPTRASAPESLSPGAEQPVEVSNTGNTVANAVQSDSGVAVPLGAKPDPHKRAAKDPGKLPGKPTASEAEPGDSKAGQPPNKHYIPNEL